MEPLPNPCFAMGVFFLALSLSALLFMPARTARADEPRLEVADQILEPAPELTPRQVIAAQLVGLQVAADPDADPAAGMRVVWNFAAPANQEVTGPFERFDAMVRAEPYNVLVGHAEYEIARLDHDPDRRVAQALVGVTGDDGEEHWFIWMLTKPEDGVAAGCWVTGAVVPIDAYEDEADPGQIV